MTMAPLTDDEVDGLIGTNGVASKKNKGDKKDSDAPAAKLQNLQRQVQNMPRVLHIAVVGFILVVLIKVFTASGGNFDSGSVEKNLVNNGGAGQDLDVNDKDDDTPALKSSETETSSTNENTKATTAKVAVTKHEGTHETNIEHVGDNGHHPDVYHRRGRPLDATEKAKLATKWGQWTFDKPRNHRPNYEHFSHRDVPSSELPGTGAWQTDPEYLPEFLQESKKLVERAMETILAEYGYGKFQDSKSLQDLSLNGESFEKRRDIMFNLTIHEKEALRVIFSKNAPKNGGWTTQKSMDGLVRRVLHAMITEDDFTMVLAGHSIAAGHGNNFQQSYILQAHRVLEPVFARLGIKLFTHNLAKGGLNTLQDALASQSLYGDDVDLLIWDSRMTEQKVVYNDIFVRQGLLGKGKVPFIMGGHMEVLSFFYDRCDIDVGHWGIGNRKDWPIMTSKNKDEIPWAQKYLNCNGGDLWDSCRLHKYSSICWVPRDDFTPPTIQNADVGHQTSWHYGYREHQVRSRTIAMMILRALSTAIDFWISSVDVANNKFLPDDQYWHVSDYYENIQLKILEVRHDDGFCKYLINHGMPKEYCKYPFKGATEFTPRANPAETSIRSIMKPASDGYLPTPNKNIYNPPDVHIPTLFDVPRGEVDYLAIMENGVDFQPTLPTHVIHKTVDGQEDTSGTDDSSSSTGNKLLPVGGGKFVHFDEDKIEPGLGWSVDSPASPDFCDGSFDSFCGRDYGNPCLLYAHNDYRGGLAFDSLSGWGIFTLKGMEHGIVTIRIEKYHFPEQNPRTKGWTTVNNEKGKNNRNLLRSNDYNTTEIEKSSIRDIYNVDRHKYRQEQIQRENAIYEETIMNNTISTTSLRERRRELRRFPPDLCKNFKFDIAINGEIETWNKEEFLSRLTNLARVVDVVHILNDPDFVKEHRKGEGLIDLEVGIRMRGCQHTNVFYLTHIYWS